MARLLSLVALTLALASSVEAYADPADQARKHFDAGTTAYNLGNFTKAVEEYKQAYTLKQDPLILYNIAQAARLGGDLPVALFFYKSYLRNDRAAKRKDILERIASIEKQIEEQRRPPNEPAAPRELSSRPPEPAPVPEPTRVEPRPAEPVATTTPAATRPTPSASTDEKPRQPIYKKWWLWTIVGVVVVAGVGAGVGVALTSQPSPPSSTLGNTALFLRF